MSTPRSAKEPRDEPVSAPIEAFDGLWQLRDVRYDGSAPVELRIRTPRRWHETRIDFGAYDDKPFSTTSIWDYTDIARYIVTMRERDGNGRWMLEGGDEEVLFRKIGQHRLGPDDVDEMLQVRRHRHHVIELEVSRDV